jgi:hypothetical protein
MAPRKIDNRKDILLLMLYSPGRTDDVNEPIVGRTRIVKMMFLFREEALPHFRRGTEITADNFYNFFAWNFGPFSQQVYDDLNFFALRGFVDVSEAEEEGLPESAEEWHEWLSQSGATEDAAEPEEYREEVFRLTPKGGAFASSLYEALSSAQSQLLREFKRRLTTTPLRAILRYVYNTYPKMTEQSKIRDQVLGRHSG